jgi:hypothetical protein
MSPSGRIAGDFELERRTGVPVKGKGDMTTYILLGERTAPEPTLATAGSPGQPSE